MNTKLGSEVTAGDEVKYHGRWYVVDHFYRRDGRHAWRTAQANGAGFRSKAILLHDDESYPVRRDAAVTPFLYMQPVVIRYPNVSAVGVSRRRAVVIRDDRGPKVRVRWSADDKKIPGRRYVEYHGAQHEQWILRDRLEAG